MASPKPMTKLEAEMTDALTQLLVMEGMEAGDEFYFEFGWEFKKRLKKLLTHEQVMAAQLSAEQQLKEITE